jgi:hypothetical protein
MESKANRKRSADMLTTQSQATAQNTRRAKTGESTNKRYRSLKKSNDEALMRYYNVTVDKKQKAKLIEQCNSPDKSEIIECLSADENDFLIPTLKR